MLLPPLAHLAQNAEAPQRLLLIALELLNTTGCCASSLAAVDLCPRSDGSRHLKHASVHGQGAIAGGCVSSARSVTIPPTVV
jgi:hypothetical protein